MKKSDRFSDNGSFTKLAGTGRNTISKFDNGRINKQLNIYAEQC